MLALILHGSCASKKIDPQTSSSRFLGSLWSITIFLFKKLPQRLATSLHDVVVDRYIQLTKKRIRYQSLITWRARLGICVWRRPKMFCWEAVLTPTCGFVNWMSTLIVVRQDLEKKENFLSLSIAILMTKGMSLRATKMALFAFGMWCLERYQMNSVLVIQRLPPWRFTHVTPKMV